MTSEQIKNTPNASAGYAALRHGGAPAWRAGVELGLTAGRAARLEELFRARRGGGPDDPMKPRYARNGRHAADVLAAGGYPVLPARRR
ncbi:MAG TPA: hypothetical protein VHV27_00030 [Phenylobacterium sp.]|jgi:hypothetical protein|nr:hypothetical protein [Phenylobacterium sp.]